MVTFLGHVRNLLAPLPVVSSVRMGEDLAGHVAFLAVRGIVSSSVIVLCRMLTSCLLVFGVLIMSVLGRVLDLPGLQDPFSEDLSYSGHWLTSENKGQNIGCFCSP